VHADACLNPVSAQHGAHRHSAGNTFSQAQYVRHKVESLTGKKGAGSAEPGLNLINTMASHILVTLTRPKMRSVVSH